MRIALACSLATLALGAAACTTVNHQTARLEAANTLQKAQAVDYTVAEAVGRHAQSWGDRWTATNLFERAVDKENTVTGRFNLAAGYEATGRLTEAAAIYATLVDDGQFVWARTSVDRRNPDRVLTRFNVADESARRLSLIRSRLNYAPGSVGGAVAATDLGTPVAATVGAGETIVARRVSDDEALRRDAAVNPG